MLRHGRPDNGFVLLCQRPAFAAGMQDEGERMQIRRDIRIKCFRINYILSALILGMGAK